MSSKIITAILTLAIGALAFATTAYGASFSHVTTPAVPHVSAPMQFKQVNFGSRPGCASSSRIRSRPRPPRDASLPWMVQNMYGQRGQFPQHGGPRRPRLRVLKRAISTSRRSEEPAITRALLDLKAHGLAPA